MRAKRKYLLLIMPLLMIATIILASSGSEHGNSLCQITPSEGYSSSYTTLESEDYFYDEFTIRDGGVYFFSYYANHSLTYYIIDSIGFWDLERNDDIDDVHVTNMIEKETTSSTAFLLSTQMDHNLDIGIYYLILVNSETSNDIKIESYQSMSFEHTPGVDMPQFVLGGLLGAGLGIGIGFAIGYGLLRYIKKGRII
ncbi:MAG: hypothetical protein GF311_02870 [Candidatus Lokiarchaeota archaeon]|nr:hypothetical protein [Candidatus Lokiarchaeota archaeon]